MIHDRIRGFSKPARVVAQRLEFGGRKIFRAGRWRMTERLEQAHGNQDRDVVFRETEEPGRFGDVESRRRDGQGQKVFLLLLHTSPPNRSGLDLLAWL